MDIVIGFSHSPRELELKIEGDSQAVVKDITKAIEAQEKTITLVAEGGTTVLVNLAEVAYVKVGASTPRKVGFSA